MIIHLRYVSKLFIHCKAFVKSYGIIFLVLEHFEYRILRMANWQSDAFRGRCLESNWIYCNLYQELIWQLWRHPFSRLWTLCWSSAQQRFTSGVSSILGEDWKQWNPTDCRIDSLLNFYWVFENCLIHIFYYYLNLN